MASEAFRITFYGDAHNWYDINGAHKATQTFQSGISQGFQQNVYFTEGAMQTTEQVKQGKAEQVQDGNFSTILVRRALIRQLGINPSSAKTNDRKIQIDQSTIQQIVDRKLMPESWLRDYFVFANLDALANEAPIETDSEANSEKAHKLLLPLRTQADNACDNAQEAFRNGNYEAGITLSKKYYHHLLQSTIIREQGVVNQIKGRINYAIRTGQSIYLFVHFGNVHYPIISKLQQKRDLAALGSFETILSQENTPTFEIGNHLRNKVVPAESLFTQDWLQKEIIEHLINGYIASRNLDTLVDNFDIVFQRSTQITKAIPSERLKELVTCRTSIPRIIEKFS